MGFEIFTSYGAAARSEATLRASGYLFLPRAMTLRIGVVEQQKKLVLLVDAENCLLGIRMPKEDDPEDSLRDVSHEISGIAINIVPVLKTMQLVKPKRKLTLPVEQQHHMLVVNMVSASALLQ